MAEQSTYYIMIHGAKESEERAKGRTIPFENMLSMT
jgi:murein L,D-transpeptidase YafK